MKMEERNLELLVHNSIDGLERARINFVAIDFDLTLLDIHTSGQWNRTIKELLPHVRPLFAVLIRQLLEHGIYVAIVSFSPQTKVIRDTLQEILPGYVDKIVIQAKDQSFENQAGSELRDGKLKYMAAAVTEITKCLLSPGQNVEITRASSLLIDDDKKNVEISLNSFIRALLFDPANPLSVLDDMTEF